MACHVILELTVKPDRVSELREWLADTLPAARELPGYVSLSLLESVDNPGEILVHQHWASRQYYEEFREWYAKKQIFAPIYPMLVCKPECRFFDYFGT